MGWTGFDGDDQATLALNLVTGHGRAMPSLWLSVWKDELKDRRNDFEDACPLRLSKLAPPGCRVTIVADRGFGDHKPFAYLAELGFGHVIRFRGNIHVTDAFGETRTAAEWVGKSGRARKLRAAFAMALLTMLGAAGESLGMDRQLKSNTSKTRTHSLFRQGWMLNELIPNMPEHRLMPLMQRFAEMPARSGLVCWLIPEAQ
jgi:hypothetical protein